ncbi:hypothetical protein D9M68_443140 [compost metagenome]
MAVRRASEQRDISMSTEGSLREEALAAVTLPDWTVGRSGAAASFGMAAESQFLAPECLHSETSRTYSC